MNKDKNHNSPLNNPSFKESVFQTPADYFDQLEGQLMDRINAEEGELASAEHLKENVFEAPQGYFNQLEDQIKARVETEAGKNSLENNDHLKTSVFEVPSGYFDRLENSINDRLEDNTATKVIPLYRKNWFRVAVAAMLAVGIFLGVADRGTEDGGFKDVSNELILDYLSEDADYDYELMAMTSDFDGIIDDILIDETFGLDFDNESNLELEYDFEYFEQ